MSKAADTFHSIIVELSALMDERLATIASINDEVAAELMLDPRYYTREDDYFAKITDGKIDDAVYREAYAKRGEEILKMARPTKVLDMLMELIHKLASNAARSPLVTGFKLEVTTWPHRFDADGNRMLENVLAAYLGKGLSIKIGCWPPSMFSPSYLRRECSAIIWYHFNEWLAANQDELEHVKIPEVMFLTPTITHMAERRPDTDTEENPFAVTEFAFSTSMGVHMQPAHIFSINPPAPVNKSETAR